MRNTNRFLLLGHLGALSGVVWLLATAASARSHGVSEQTEARAVASRPAAVRLPVGPEAAALAEAAKASAGAAVLIESYRSLDGEPAVRRGSGAVATTSGHVFAPLHLVDDADYLIITFSGKVRRPASVMARDEGNGLALLRSQRAPGGLSARGLGGGTDEQVGAPVALVTPAGSELLGVVTGREAGLAVSSEVLAAAVRGTPDPVGGILVNTHGELVGLALGTGAPAGPHSSTTLYVLPASRIDESLDRILLKRPGTEAKSKRRFCQL